ncbi:MAG: ABC transporter ATP-binding protein [Dehalococcoidales bacterium]
MEHNPDLVVETKNLTKRFGKIIAVDELSIEVFRGEVFGFLGPNGSGKSTTMGMILGLIAPTSGSVSVFGLDVTRHLPDILSRTGALTESTGFYPYLSGYENLRYFARITGGISGSRIEEVLEMVDLKSRANDPFSNYSLGMKQRLGLASALLGDPEFIILDEPTNGLDPAGMKEIRELITLLGQQGKTVFLNSHLLHEVQQVCDRVAIIKKGRVITQGSVKELLNQTHVLQVKTTQTDDAFNLLSGMDWLKNISRNEERILLEVEPEYAYKVSAVLAEKGIYLTEMKYRENTLEDLFLELTGEAAI